MESASLPTLSQSRFVPLTSALDDLSETLLWNARSQAKLWNLYLKGYQTLVDEELFYLPDTLTSFFHKKSVQSYQAIQTELQNPDSAALHWLAYMTFIRDQLNRPIEKEGFPLELNALAPGLWLKVVDGHVRVFSLPKAKPWSLWKKGLTLGLYEGRDKAKKNFLKSKTTLDNFYALLRSQKIFEHFQNPAHLNSEYQSAVEELQNQAYSPQKISEVLQSNFHLSKRLELAGSFFKLLPPLNASGEWIGLNALLLDRYEPKSGQLSPLENFTVYSDTIFVNLQRAYRAWVRDPQTRDSSIWIRLLQEGYAPLQDQSYLDTAQGQITYPSFFRLQLEAFYVSTPLWPIVLLLLILSLITAWGPYPRSALLLFGLAFLGQTLLLVIRCYLLERPPVTNMAESLIFVPWTASCLALLCWIWTKSKSPIYAAVILTIPLLGFAIHTEGAQKLEQVQPVLNSQYWLTVHVLMVVSSYGAFLLSGVLAHWDLWKLYKKRKFSALIARLTLQGMYLGTALLISGTLLGGVWAAQSWGRFWDWDPKEAWAFITSLLYLIWIHAYRFHLISISGLYIGAIIGLQAVSFTWYGVNYILGTGLHSYGFGNGGELIYLTLIVLDILFVSFIAIKIVAHKTEDAFSHTSEKTT